MVLVLLKGNGVDTFRNMTADTNCTLVLRNAGVFEHVKEFIDNGNRLIIFSINISGALGPLSGQYPGKLFNKHEWILITEEAGKTLLLFPDDYVARSFYTLSFGTQFVEMNLDQRPENCFSENYTLDQILNTIRSFVLRNISISGGDVSKTLEICNRKIFIEHDTCANLSYICCDDADGMCYILQSSIWLYIFNYFHIVLRIFVITVSPYFLPKHLLGTLSNYSYISRSEDSTLVIVKKIVSPEHVPHGYTQAHVSLPKFQSYMDNIACGTHFLRIKQIDISVHEDNLINDGSCSVGVLQFLYKKLVKFEMESDNVLNNCCTSNIFTVCSKCCYVPWSTCVKLFSVISFFTIVMSPWLVTVVHYYVFRQQLLNDVNSANQFLHVQIYNIKTVEDTLCLLILPAIPIFLIAFFLAIYSSSLRSESKILLRHYIYGGKSLKTAFSEFTSSLMHPLEKFGIFGCIVLPIWAVVCLMVALSKTLYPIKSFINMFKLKCGQLNISHNFNYAWYTILLQIFFINYILIYISSCVVFYTGSVSYATVGLLLNYDDVSKYIFLILLIAAYGFNCFDSVNKRYDHFLKVLNEKVQSKIINQLENVKFEAEDETTDRNMAFSMTGRQNYRNRFISTGHLSWKAQRLVYFLDMTGKIPIPRLSRKFFQDMSISNNLACPGSEYVLYIKALRDFILVVIYLLFIIVVVFALGKANDLSSGVQTLVALGGGFLPFVLGKFVFKSHTAEISKVNKNLWERMLEQKMDSYEEMFNVKDIEVSMSDDFFLNIQDSTTQSFDLIFCKKMNGEAAIFCPNTNNHVEESTFTPNHRTTYGSFE